MSNDNVWQCSHQSSLWYWRALCCFPCFTHPITALFCAEVICESFGVPSNLDYCLGQDSGAEWSTGISFDFPTELQGAGRNNLPVASRPSRPVSAAPWWRAMPTVTEGRWRGRRAALSSGLVPGVPAGSSPRELSRLPESAWDAGSWARFSAPEERTAFQEVTLEVR